MSMSVKKVFAAGARVVMAALERYIAYPASSVTIAIVTAPFRYFQGLR